VYLHSLVRTAGGEKMSKVQGDGTDPVALNQHTERSDAFLPGVDGRAGNRYRVVEDRLASARNFANKI